MHYLYIYQKYYDMMFFLIQTEKVKISKYQIVFPPPWYPAKQKMESERMALVSQKN